MSNNEAKGDAADINNLQENFSKQQKKISALKELVRKSDVAHNKSTSLAKEKVKSIAQKLTHLKSKARSRQSLDLPEHDATIDSEVGDHHELSLPLSQTQPPIAPPAFASPQTPLMKQDQSKVLTPLNPTATVGNEKIMLLRQQVEQNKARMAQRASSKLHLEQLVSQLKENFNTTQQSLEDATELGKSMCDLSAYAYAPVTRERYRSATDLSSQPFNLEKERIKFLENRCRMLEKQLEKERLANKNHEVSNNDSTASEASTKRIKELENKVLELEKVLKEQSFEVKEKSVVDECGDLKAKIERLEREIGVKDAECAKLRDAVAKQQTESNHNYESNELQNESVRLRQEIEQKLQRITELEGINNLLETSHRDLSVKCNEIEKQFQQLRADLIESEENLQQAKDEIQQLESKCTSLQETLDKLQALQSVKTAADTDADVKVEMAKQIHQLQQEVEQVTNENAELNKLVSESKKLEVSDASIADKIASLEATIESQRDDLQVAQKKLHSQEELLMEKTIELNVLNANFKVLEDKLQASSKNKSLFGSKSGAPEGDHPELHAENQQLKQKLDESNKAMIKLKLKCKQVEKQIEKLKKSSDLHAEVVRLEKINEDMQQKIVELEDEKGHLQLSQVNVPVEKPAEKQSLEELTSAPATDLEETCKKQSDTIRLLEQQKFEQTEKLESLRQELESLQEKFNCQQNEESARVKSEMSEIHLEEQLEAQLEEQAQSLNSLQELLATRESEIKVLQQKCEELEKQKQQLNQKLDHYIAENMELLDKVEKLSKSSSSAESIEIVEQLTQQERAEIDAFNKRQTASAPSSVTEDTQTEMAPELSENIVQLRDVSSELMNKIELFTSERREVLEKMERLTAENHQLVDKIEELTEQQQSMEASVLLAENEKSKLEVKLQELAKDKDLLVSQVAESTAQKSQLSQELTSLQKSSEVVATLDSSQDAATLFDKCEKSLSKLHNELETYRKANDKNAKFNVSKKLAKEAKNVHTQFSELLQKVKEASTAVETVTVVETVVAVTAPNGKALAEYEQLTAQNRQLKATIDELRRELDAAQDPCTVVSELPAIDNQAAEEAEVKLRDALDKANSYENQLVELQSTVEDLRRQLREELIAGEEKTDSISRLNAELASLRQMSEDFDRLINDKEMSFEKQIEHMTRLRRELEGKCETYEGEMEILQTLVAEQKQQLVEAYKENEHEINVKLLELQQRDELILQLRQEIKELKAAAAAQGEKSSTDLQKECEQLREMLKINKTLLAEQVNELSNKQETIETLNQQIIDLYKIMEENTNKVTEKEDELSYLQELMENNNNELERLRKDNDEQKSVVDKLLNELHSHRQNTQHLPQLQQDLERLEKTNQHLELAKQELEKRHKEQMEKLKKYAANLKKRTTQCQELEEKLKQLEKGALEEQLPKEMQCNSEELQELTANNLLLNERINALETELRQKESELFELKEALQLKTVEGLESNERNLQLEEELERLHRTLLEKNEENLQLQMEFGNIRNELGEKSTSIARLETNLKRAQQQLLNKDAYEKILQELTEKTTALECAEAALVDVQAELLRLQEIVREKEESENDMCRALLNKETLIEGFCEHRSVMESRQQILEAEVQRLSEELKAKSLKFEKSKAVIKERNNQIQRLTTQLKELQDKLSDLPEEEPAPAVVLQPQLNAATQIVQQEAFNELKEAYEKLKTDYATEKANFQDTIARLETVHDGIQAKLQEDMSYIESLEQENAQYKEKICKLQECVGDFEERCASRERSAKLLDDQMQTRADEYKEHEDELLNRLKSLSEHDSVLAQRLQETEVEKEDLQQRLERMKSEVKELNCKHANLEAEYNKYKEFVETGLGAEVLSLREQLKTADAEFQRMRSTYDAKLASKATEIDQLECDLSDQLDRKDAEKRIVSEELERTHDRMIEQSDEILRMSEELNAAEQAKQELERELSWLRVQNGNSQHDQYELQELRMQSMQDKNELEHLRHSIDNLINNHEIELQALRTQISELDTLRMQVGQNQTDDQVFIETENRRLTDLLAEKDALIERYQQQNLQLQMAGAATQQASATDLFASPASISMERAAQLPADTQHLEREVAALNRQLEEKNLEIEHLRAALRRAPAAATAAPALPPLFFASEALPPSPFDEIVLHTRRTEHALDSMPPSRSRLAHTENSLGEEQPTIEDLQRNVSDLEKHAQDLENKLAARNQATGEYEERLRQLQHNLRERDQLLDNARLEVQTLIEHNASQQLNHAAVEQQLEELRNLLKEAEEQLKTRDERLAAIENEKQLKEQKLAALEDQFKIVQQQLKQREEKLTEMQLEQQMKATEVDVQANQWAQQLSQLEQMHSNAQYLQALLKERDDEINQLKCALTEEQQFKKSVATQESQVPTAVDAHQPSLNMFFGAAPATDFENLLTTPAPVVEETIVPEKAYLCHPEGDTTATTTATALDLGGDWGDSWNADEAAVEATNFTATQPISLLSAEHQLEIQLQEKLEYIEELKLALERSEQQKQELQVKSGKLMKKLKEYKTKVDTLESSSNSAFRKSASVESNNAMFGDLDAAIQEELKAQVQKLEEKLAEERKLQDSNAMEKEKLLKRIDVLTAGNERMSEMKERQDMDVKMYQARIRELQDKLHNLEDWGVEDNRVTKSNVSQVETQRTHAEVPQMSEPGREQLEQKIKELTAELQDINGDRQELQALLEDEKANVARAEHQIQSLQVKMTELENAGKDSAELQLELEKLRTTQTELQEANEKLTAELRTLKTENQRLQNELQQQQSEVQKLKEALRKSEENTSESNELRSQLLALQQQNQASISDKEEQLQRQKDYEKEICELQTQIARLQATERATATGTSTTQFNIDEFAAQLQEKEAEIVHLKQRIEDLMQEDQTEKLVLEILSKNQEIHMLKMRAKHLEEEKQELEHNLTLQITKEMENRAEKSDEQTESAKLREELQNSESQVQELLRERASMEEELKVLNNHVLSSLEMEDKVKATMLELDMKNIELNELRKTLETLKSSSHGAAGDDATNNAAQIDFVALNAKWETIVEQRCGEIAESWRIHMEQRQHEFEHIEKCLRDEIATLRLANSMHVDQHQQQQPQHQQQQQQQQGMSADSTASATTTPASDTPASGSCTSSAAVSKDCTPLRRARIISEADNEAELEADAIITKMQAALESQEMEIVTLKEQLAIRSAEYARLAAQYDPFQMQTTLSHSGMGSGAQTASDSSVVPKSELDLAYYMLHQRDMRCEELTLELVSLLEERDMLQLKLSNTLRQVESIKAQTSFTEASSVGADMTTSPSPVSAGVPTASESPDDLTQKLSQLQTVNHSKDKVIKEERDQRIRQMEKMQQDIAKIPPAAVSELVGTDFSQTNQSPSTVLLNWFMGNRSPTADSGAPTN